jgi:hypothetical protein
MATVKWQISYGGELTRVEIEKETDKCVWIKWSCGRVDRTLKINSWHKFFNSFPEAKQYLVDRARTAVERCKRDLPDAENQLAVALALTEPKEDTR